VIDTTLTRQLRAELVARLVAEDASLSPGWRPAFERVPRHVFVPRIHRQNGQGIAEVLDSSAHEAWLAGVYSDEALVTRVHDRNGDTSLSSSSAPSVMWAMLDALEVSPGQRVLEIGTGTGYNAALLSERLGSANLTSVDIDRELVASAGRHLADLGYRPTLAVGDGAGGYAANAPYDRVVATCAVRRIPAAWVDQTRPGGLILATMPYGMARLRVAADGSAAGRFHPTSFAFMGMREGLRPAEPLSVAKLFELARGAGESRPTSAAAVAAVELRSALWMVVRIVALPDLAVLDLGDGALGFVDRASRAWARLAGHQVVEGGSWAIWKAVESIHARWHEAGEPERGEIGLRLDPDRRQRLWLRSPDSGFDWEL
jgi:protein-L-isoaspartate O-methyltransferase